MASAPAEGVKRKSRRGMGGDWKVAALFLLPVVALLVAFRVIPMAQAVVLSLQSWDGFSDPQYVGFANYGALLQDPTFKQALLNNGLILLSIPIWILLPLAVAIALHHKVPGWRLFRLAFFLPAVLSPVVIGSYYEILLRFDGPANELLRGIGLGGLAHEWLTDSSTALPVVIAILIWASFGIGVLIFLSALATVNHELYDAARLDGASWTQTQRFVTVPAILPTIEFYAVVIVISMFTVLFPYIYTLTGGGPGYATYVLELEIYQQAFQSGNFGYASAMGVVLFGVVGVLVLVQLRVFRRRGVA